MIGFKPFSSIFALALIAGLQGAPLLAQASGERLAPNEMGEIMILMYHQIRSPEREYVRTAENFRKDLEALYERGYRLANLNDVLDGRITTEAGRTPVVLTFDDSAAGQIDKIRKNGGDEWAPDTAVGIIVEFAKQHPDMGIAGTFYINPFYAHMDRSKSGEWKEWMREMFELGFEFGNHTMTHPNLKKDRPTYEAVEKEIGGLQAWLHQYLPDYTVRTMALPFGVYPAETKWAVSGSYEGEKYHHEALMKVGANPAVSPYSRNWEPNHLPRIRAQDGPNDLPVSSYWIEYFDRHPEKRFVSDGNPRTVTIPARGQAELNPSVSAHFKVIHR